MLTNLPRLRHIMLLGATGLMVTTSSMAQQAAEAPAPKENVLKLGIGAVMATRYPGSDERAFGAGPTFDYTMTNGFFISMIRGIGYGSTVGDFSYSAALGYRPGRKEKSATFFPASTGSSQLAGMGSIKNSATLVLNGGYVVAKWLSVNAMIETPLTARETGTRMKLGASSPLYQTSTDRVAFNVHTSIGDSKHMQSWFGVTEEQSANSGYTAYKPKSGFYEVGTSVSWSHQFNSQWGIYSAIGAHNFIGDAGKSPITKRKLTPTAAVQINYLY